MKTVKFWTRVARNGKEQWQLVEGRDESGVPEVCWRKYNAAFWQRFRDGKLKPADPLACYQDGCAAIVVAATKVKMKGEEKDGRVQLRHASPVTYITSAGLVRMKQFVREDIAPKRAEQSQMFDKCRVNGVLDVQAYVENLPSLMTVDAALADDLARECVAVTLAKCAAETRLALRVYMAWDLCAEDAAHVLGMKRQTFAWQRDHKWFPEFRANCTWRWLKEKFMHIDKDRFGEDIVMYDSQEEEREAIRNYLRGNFAALTCEEVAFFRSCEEDSNGFRWEADHAGMMSDEVDELDFNGLVFIYDLGRTFEEGKEILLRRIGPHPITPLTIFELANKLEKESRSRK